MLVFFSSFLETFFLSKLTEVTSLFTIFERCNYFGSVPHPCLKIPLEVIDRVEIENH